MKDTCNMMDISEDYDRPGVIVPPRNNMVFKISLVPIKETTPTSVEIEMPVMAGVSSETVGHHSSYSHASTTSHGTVKSQYSGDSNRDAKYHGADAWWSVRDFIQPGVNEGQGQDGGTTFSKTNDDDTWDLSDSIVDLYKESNKYDGVHNQSPTTRTSSSNKVDMQQWIQEDTNNGLIRVYKSEMDTNPRLFPSTLTTTAQKLCIQCSMPPNSLHVQFNGDIIRRLDPFDSPLALQNEYLQSIGYTDQSRIQEVGMMEDLSFLVKFYAGKPLSDSTYSRNQLQTWAYVRKGKLIYQWVRRLCIITGTRLLIYRDKTKTGKPTIVQLAKGSVEEVQNTKGHDFVLKLTSTLQGERSVYLSFNDEKDYTKWMRKTKKATAKLPTKADLSNCHLEFIPETVFINSELEILNLRHNVLKERPIEEDIYTIGWLDDLPRFSNLHSLNLADNSLLCFPVAICKMRTLTELNLASNKIEDIPPDIMELENLQMLHLHNNHLNYLPDELCRMRHLLVLVLAFNHFTSVPSVLLQSNESLLRIDSLIMAGNRMEKLSHGTLNKMHHIKKIDFRMNKLTFSPSEMAKFHLLEKVTHLDVRDNSITDLDVRPLRNLEYLNCERNSIHSLQVSGGAIKTLLASHNDISTFTVSPKPEWLVMLDLSHNKLESLPLWVSDCFFLVQLNASHNQLTHLPDKLLSEAQKLKVLHVSHNQLTCLPDVVGNAVLEELSLEHNLLTHLPTTLFTHLTKLRYICLTKNQLVTIPEGNQNIYQNKLQELYLSANCLCDDIMGQISVFHKLKVLHLAYNKITDIHDRDLRKLENLHELNISGNYLRHLPRCVGRHSKLQALRSNANLLKELPDFRYSPNLKVLEVGSNRLVDVSVTNLMASNVNLLDISGNPEMEVNSNELKGIKTKKKVCMVDIKGQNRSLLDLRTAGFEELEIPWQSGLSQTSGIRNKLSVSVVNKPKFNEGQEGLFAIFDGGRNDEVTRILSNRIAGILEEELEHPITSQDYLKYTILAAHRKLKSTGQKVGAAGAICHLRRSGSGSSNYVLNVANLGDTEIVLCRRGEAIVLSKLFTVDQNKEEMERICKAGGIITEDNRINGVTQSSRLLGSSYLFPNIIPDPYVSTTTIQPEDQLIIIANQGLWKYISYQEAVNEVIDIPDPVLAAKKLQDLSQGYHSQENIAVLVIRLMMFPAECNRMRDLLRKQFELEQRFMTELKVRDIEREETRKRAELEEMNDSVSMEIVKLKGGKRRKQVGTMFNGKNGESSNKHDDIDSVIVKTLPSNGHHSDNDVTANWELLLQKRLTEEVKDKELIHAMRVEEYDPYFPTISQDNNWSTTTKLKGQMKERKVTLPPEDDYKHPMSSTANTTPPPPPHLQRRHIIPEDAQLSTESLEFHRELKPPLNVDRDAILFHNMQLTRQKSRNMSTNSIDSTQSDFGAYSSIKEVSSEKKSSSHSIEVLLHGPAAQQNRTSEFGGSYKIPPQEIEVPNRNSMGDSCPTEMPMSDRLKMLEEKGFLPNSDTDLNKDNADKLDRRLKAEDAEQAFSKNSNGNGADEKVHSSNGSIEKYCAHVTDHTSVGGKDSGGVTQHSGTDSESGTEEILITGQKFNASQEINGEFQKIISPNVSWDDYSVDGSSEIMIMGGDLNAEKFLDPVELYATVRKVKPKSNGTSVNEKNVVNLHTNNITVEKTDKNSGAEHIKPDNVTNNSSNTTNDHSSVNSKSKEMSASAPGKKHAPARPPPPIPPRMPPATLPKADINSNSIKSLEDLITYNRLQQQQQKTSYKVTRKVAPPPPPKLPDSTMVTKTASQRSIIITYL